jgi:hypothetical protein
VKEAFAQAALRTQLALDRQAAVRNANRRIRPCGYGSFAPHPVTGERGQLKPVLDKRERKWINMMVLSGYRRPAERIVPDVSQSGPCVIPDSMMPLPCCQIPGGMLRPFEIRLLDISDTLYRIFILNDVHIVHIGPNEDIVRI